MPKRQLNFSVEAHEWNPFVLKTNFVKQARKEKWTDAEIREVMKAAESGSYEHLIATLKSHCLEYGYPEETDENLLDFEATKPQNMMTAPLPKPKEQKVATEEPKSSIAKRYLRKHPEYWTRPTELAAIASAAEGVEVKASDVSSAKTQMMAAGEAPANAPRRGRPPKAAAAATAAAVEEEPQDEADFVHPLQSQPASAQSQPVAAAGNGEQTMADVIVSLKELRNKVGGAGEMERLFALTTRLGGSAEAMKIVRAFD